MVDIKHNIDSILREIDGRNCTLIAVSKTKPNELIQEAYNSGQIHFGENKVQELAGKYEILPKDIKWHMIGHLQRNKVKYIAPFVHLIHSVDSERLLKAIDKEARKAGRVIDCLLQVHIAEESTKFGFDEEELLSLLHSDEFANLKNINIKGLMGMATFTEDQEQIRREFSGLKKLFDKIKNGVSVDNISMDELSMGMSGDYMIALECGSTMIRVGSSIFGERNYA
ncbi:YggS family pyridoxal phosphate-dependent enzyme [Marinoscillum sp. MHG1-6]|uniref:YggS family pyridoxal phosphate-dependent enzyme n=1 Tax=Marinoscillum sp. MHG1-6 TaxID=2959627 RepID=UPI0021587C64|nr:YggS family pyridoxal phosphate-dependent enzyme [Marinoscillum sp. MHG1-6]